MKFLNLCLALCHDSSILSSVLASVFDDGPKCSVDPPACLLRLNAVIISCPQMTRSLIVFLASSTIS